jgi:hypothetical protein
MVYFLPDVRDVSLREDAAASLREGQAQCKAVGSPARTQIWQEGKKCNRIRGIIMSPQTTPSPSVPHSFSHEGEDAAVGAVVLLRGVRDDAVPLAGVHVQLALVISIEHHPTGQEVHHLQPFLANGGDFALALQLYHTVCVSRLIRNCRKESQTTHHRGRLEK